ncbi:MAG: hypothetical protein L0323_23590 [Planctomycetes bacterium]|nr:hypothetical protein [Planctomycetota bacterium]
MRGVLLGLASLLPGLRQQPGDHAGHSHEPFPVPEGDRVVLSRFAEALLLAPRLRDALWPGFDARGLPIAVFRPGGVAYVSGHPKPPHAFRELALPGGAPPPPILYAPATAEMRSNATLKIDGLLFSTLEARGFEPPSPPEDSIGVLFHEAFHNFAQRAAPKSGAENPLDGAEFPDLDPRLLALAVLEAACLRDALGETDEARTRERALRFLALRSERSQVLGPRLAAWEEGVEWNEGLATYAETRSILLAGERGLGPGPLLAASEPSFTRYPATADYLARRFAELFSPGVLPDRSRARLYLTGAAQGLLLDRFSPGWKDAALSRPAPPSRLLAEALKFDPASAPALARAAREEYSFDTVLVSETRSAREVAEKRGREAEIHLAKEDALVVLEAAGAGQTEPIFVDPPSLRRLDGDRMFHGRVLRLRFPGRGSASFERPVLADAPRSVYRAALSLKAFRLTIDGRDVSLSGEPGPVGRGEVGLSSAGLTIQGSDVEVREDREGTRRVLVARFLPRGAPK